VSSTRTGGEVFGHDGTPGKPLPATVRHQMEVEFGVSFSDVRVHDGSMATVHNKDAGAGAFAKGDQIFVAPGAYQPGTQAGNRLIAHELAHVVQQSRGSSSP